MFTENFRKQRSADVSPAVFVTRLTREVRPSFLWLTDCRRFVISQNGRETRDENGRRLGEIRRHGSQESAGLLQGVQSQVGHVSGEVRLQLRTLSRSRSQCVVNAKFCGQMGCRDCRSAGFTCDLSLIDLSRVDLSAHMLSAVSAPRQPVVISRGSGLILVCPCIHVRLSWVDKTSVLLLFQ